MGAGEVRKRFNAPLLQPVLDFAEVWFKDRKQITFHDPLAATTIFDDRICTFERGAVSVELASEPLGGLTHFEPDAAARHEVALGVEPRRFFDHFFGMF
jgi:purine nucleosidase